MSIKIAQELFDFIENSPTSFHAVETMRQMLLQKDYQELLEGSDWDLKPGGKYFVSRNGSSLIAFRIPTVSISGFQIMASHSDSPMFKIKENPEIHMEHYIKLNIEKYGGMLCAPWFDRPLSIAGRLVLKTEQGIESRLIDAKRDLLMIPSLAIHMNRTANEGQSYHIQKDLLPVFGDESASGSFLTYIASLADIPETSILAHDLYVYSRTPGTIWGIHNEYISSGRLDDLQCAFASLKGFFESGTGSSVPLHCVFDNEEVGSGTKQGAASTFLLDTLIRICDVFNKTSSEYRKLLSNSFMISADNAHAVHPNNPEKACPTNRPFINGGIVLKYSANQKYTTDGIAAALFKEICNKAGVKYQVFLNHSDVLGGSTLGNLSATQVAVNTVDIGLPQLAMHSPYETAGIHDTDDLIKAAKIFYESSISEISHNQYSIK